MKKYSSTDVWYNKKELLKLRNEALNLLVDIEEFVFNESGIEYISVTKRDKFTKLVDSLSGKISSLAE